MAMISTLVGLLKTIFSKEAAAVWERYTYDPALVFTNCNFAGKSLGSLKVSTVPKKVFTVFEADNGFYAAVGEGNDTIVIGATLSEVCTAASAKVAEQKLVNQEMPSFQQAGWIKES